MEHFCIWKLRLSTCHSTTMHRDPDVALVCVPDAPKDCMCDNVLVCANSSRPDSIKRVRNMKIYADEN